MRNKDIQTAHQAFASSAPINFDSPWAQQESDWPAINRGLVDRQSPPATDRDTRQPSKQAPVAANTGTDRTLLVRERF